MKKIIASILTIVAVIGLSGCGGGGSDDDKLITLFLVDEEGNSYSSIPYRCDSMTDWEETPINGEFTFFANEDCEFDFIDLDGTNHNNTSNDLIYIVDSLDSGKNGIDYDCLKFGAGVTEYDGIYDGSFEYDIDDECVFYL